MPEHRGRKHHQDRVAETLREEIGAMIGGELSDPRIASCHVSEVVLNPGGKSARVYIELDSATPEIDKERMGVRHVPDLAFFADRSERFQARIEELMTRSRKRQKTHEEPAP
jgi:ribosome-binding factor A